MSSASRNAAPAVPAVPIRARSWLFTPATRADRFENAARNGADVLIADLEDAVPPAEKDTARNNVMTLLNAPASTALPTLAIRINSTATRLGVDDLTALLDAGRMPHFILLPKIEAAEQVLYVAALLKNAGKAAALVPMIESARGMFAVRSIAQAGADAGACVAALMFGAGDYASDVRAQPASMALQLARCRIAAACAQAGIAAIDAPCFALDDPVLLQADLEFAAANGFQAKAAIHPSHLRAINAMFKPSPERLDWARRVLEASEQGAGIVDGRMVDEAIAREARQVIAAG